MSTDVDIKGKISEVDRKGQPYDGVHTGGCAHTFIFTGDKAEFMKGGVLMKSKYVATYGKKITSSNTQSNFGSYHIIDNFRCKSRITASGKTVIA